MFNLKKFVVQSSQIRRCEDLGLNIIEQLCCGFCGFGFERYNGIGFHFGKNGH